MSKPLSDQLKGMKDILHPSMGTKTRDMILKIADGHQNAFPILFLFSKLSQRDEVFRRLIGLGLTGKRFIDFYFKDCRGSFLRATSWIMEYNGPINFDPKFS